MHDGVLENVFLGADGILLRLVNVMLKTWYERNDRAEGRREQLSSMNSLCREVETAQNPQGRRDPSDKRGAIRRHLTTARIEQRHQLAAN